MPIHSITLISVMNSNSNDVLQTLINLNNETNVSNIIDCQRNMLSRFEKSNEMLINCNALAVFRYETMSADVRKYTQQLADMRNDLDSVFHRIRFLKLKLTQQYPNAFTAP